MTDSSSHENNVWSASQTDPELAEQLRLAWRDVKDPELGMDIIQLGLIREVEFKPEEVYVKMILTTVFCPYAPIMLEQTKQKAEEVLKKNVRLELGMEAWDYSMMEDGFDSTWGLF